MIMEHCYIKNHLVRSKYSLYKDPLQLQSINTFLDRNHLNHPIITPIALYVICFMKWH